MVPPVVMPIILTIPEVLPVLLVWSISMLLVFPVMSAVME
jgi:hypothetical protein